MTSLKEMVCIAENQLSQWAEGISHYLFTNPELSDQEFESSRFIVESMREQGFEVTYPYMGFETAFRCEFGNGKGKTVAFLAEYDALPGYGEHHDEVAHACGHNWIAASTAAAAAALARLGTEIDGKIVLIGTPSEEVSGRKVNMAEQGVFDDVDAVFQMHLGNQNCVDTVSTAMTDYVFEFFGQTAHAAKEPEAGINALDACHLTMAGMNAMRQQFGPEVKLHEVILDGGKTPSIIPDYASMAIYVRATTKEILERATARIENIGKGAELMTGAKFKFRRADNTYYDLKRSKWLNELMKKNLAELGIDRLEKGDKYHCESTDIGNVSYICPTCYVTLSTLHISDAGLHEQEFLEVADSERAYKLLHVAAKAMAMTALDVLLR